MNWCMCMSHWWIITCDLFVQLCLGHPPHHHRAIHRLALTTCPRPLPWSLGMSSIHLVRISLDNCHTLLLQFSMLLCASVLYVGEAESLWSANGCVVVWWTSNWEVAGSNLGQGYFTPRSTQLSIPPGSVNEYQLWLGSKCRYSSFCLQMKCRMCR